MRAMPAIELSLRIACGCYLLYLGQKLLRGAWRGRGLPVAEAPDMTIGRLFWAGFLTNLLNARVIAYYASIFTAAGAYALPWQWQMVAIFGMPAIGFSWNSFVTLVVSSPAVRGALAGATHWIDSASGAILVAFGLNLLVRG